MFASICLLCLLCFFHSSFLAEIGRVVGDTYPFRRVCEKQQPFARLSRPWQAQTVHTLFYSACCKYYKTEWCKYYKTEWYKNMSDWKDLELICFTNRTKNLLLCLIILKKNVRLARLWNLLFLLKFTAPKMLRDFSRIHWCLIVLSMRKLRLSGETITALLSVIGQAIFPMYTEMLILLCPSMSFAT